MIDIIKNKIKTELDILEIEIIDESSAHANHKGNNGGGHYRALIISDDFNNKNLVERHQMIYKALGNLMTNEIHAFSMKTMTKEEFRSND
jgi:BolA protein